jgi:serine/threonine-protein kinase
MADGERKCPSCGRSFGADVLFCPTDGVPLAPRSPGPSSVSGPDPYLGLKLLEQIEIKKLAGVGSMARVYRAFQHGIEREVAVKILHRELSSNPEIVERFHREARVASKVAHPNVVQILLTAQLSPQLPQVGGELALVMEYLDGMSLLSALRASGGALALPRALHIALQVCDAVGEAHGLGVVHRDLKPENIMLVRRGEDPDFVKVLDFGLARLSTRDASYATRAGAIFGSPRYISPEGAQGLPVEAPADVYAIATILYQCLAGRTPFEADSAVGFLLAHANEPPPKLNSHERASYVPAPLVDLLDRCLAKRPEERPADARQLGRELLDAAQRSGLMVEALLAGPGFAGARGGALSSLARTHEMGSRVELGTPLSTGTQVGNDTPGEAPPLVPSLSPAPRPSARVPARPPTLPPAEAPEVAPSAPSARPPTLPPQLHEPTAAELLAAVASSGVAPTLFDEPIPAPSAVRDRASTPAPSRPSELPDEPAAPGGSSLAPASLPVLASGSTAAPVTAVPTSPPTSPSGLPVVPPEEPLNEPPAPRSPWRSSWRTAVLVAACFGVGAGLVFAGAKRLGVVASRPAVPPADALLTEAREAAARQEWDQPPGRSVRDLLERGRAEFPADPRFAAELRQASVDITGLAVKERSNANNEEAIRLARLALVFDPTNTAASRIADELEALKSAPVASAAPPKTAPRGPRPGAATAPAPPPATRTAAPGDKGDKGGDKGDKGDKGWL